MILWRTDINLGKISIITLYIVCKLYEIGDVHVLNKLTALLRHSFRDRWDLIGPRRDSCLYHMTFSGYNGHFSQVCLK